MVTPVLQDIDMLNGNLDSGRLIRARLSDTFIEFTISSPTILINAIQTPSSKISPWAWRSFTLDGARDRFHLCLKPIQRALGVVMDLGSSALGFSTRGVLYLIVALVAVVVELVRCWYGIYALADDSLSWVATYVVDWMKTSRCSWTPWTLVHVEINEIKWSLMVIEQVDRHCFIIGQPRSINH